MNFFDKTRPEGNCLVWTGDIRADGYGQLWYQGGTRSAHRVAYELSYGPIPEGMTVDHLCNNRACVKSFHLRLATPYENTMAKHSASTARLNAEKTHCPQGHPYDATNTAVYNGRRNCRACRRAINRGGVMDALVEVLIRTLRMMMTKEGISEEAVGVLDALEQRLMEQAEAGTPPHPRFLGDEG